MKNENQFERLAMCYLWESRLPSSNNKVPFISIHSCDFKHQKVNFHSNYLSLCQSSKACENEEKNLKARRRFISHFSPCCCYSNQSSC